MERQPPTSRRGLRYLLAGFAALFGQKQHRAPVHEPLAAPGIDVHAKPRTRRYSAAEAKANAIIAKYGRREIVCLQYNAATRRSERAPAATKVTVADCRDELVSHFRTGAPLPWRFWQKGKQPNGARW